jgi:translation initiation factor 2 subunit 3
MTTMLSGAALMNGAILVIAANEEIPQARTIEHLLAVKAAGINHIVVALNKADLITKEELIKKFDSIQKFLKEHNTEAPIIPTSAQFGLNIDALIEAIEENIPNPKFDLNKPLKLYVARSFDVNKPGISPKDLKGGVIGGTIVQGILKEGDEIELVPGFGGRKIQTKVVSLSTEMNKLKEAKPGGLLGIETLMDPSMARNDGMRGNVAGLSGKVPEPVSRIKIELFYFKRLLEDVGEIINSDQLVVNAGTATTLGIVNNLKKAEKIFCDLDLKSQIVVERGENVSLLKRGKQGWRFVAYGRVI